MTTQADTPLQPVTGCPMRSEAEIRALLRIHERARDMAKNHATRAFIDHAIHIMRWVLNDTTNTAKG